VKGKKLESKSERQERSWRVRVKGKKLESKSERQERSWRVRHEALAS
jgi:hypothetical protein